MPSIVKQPVVNTEHFEDKDGAELDASEGGVTLNPEAVVDQPTKKKRKRDEKAEEDLEIDVNRREPPSKKALRKEQKDKKSKKDKSSSKSEAAGVKHGDLGDGETPINSTGGAGEDSKAGKAFHSIWIGNLPFSINRDILSQFLTETHSIPKVAVTRIHIPAPQNAKATKTTLKPLNKGFAYVDLSNEAAFKAALALSESILGGRNLLIKDAKNFEGRPVKTAETYNEDTAVNPSMGPNGKQKQPSRRIFVGNLGFDVTKEDLESHFGLCGEVEHVHMATFEDTGKCKGFGWVTFAAEFEKDGEAKTGERAAGDAAQGFTYMLREKEESDEEEVDEEEEDKKPKKKVKKRKWFVNRLQGRMIRCEFAEDSSTRYKKRFGKEARQQNGQFDANDVQISGAGPSEESPRYRRRDQKAGKAQVDHFLGDIRPGAPTDPGMRRSKGRPKWQDDTRYRTGAITESSGNKTSFE